MTPQEIQDKIEAIITAPKTYINPLATNQITISCEDRFSSTITIRRDSFLFWHTYKVSIDLFLLPVKSARKLWMMAQEQAAARIYKNTLKSLNTLHDSLVNTSNIKH
jgi:hypothetical protein